MMRCLRPERMIYALQGFIEERYFQNSSLPFEESFKESGSATPMFFILSPGVDPLKDVEALGKKLGYTSDEKNFHNILLGQGQEVVAEEAMEIATADGRWVVLQNVHLVKTWLNPVWKSLSKVRWLVPTKTIQTFQLQIEMLTSSLRAFWKLLSRLPINK